jgi:hypothetical protein
MDEKPIRRVEEPGSSGDRPGRRQAWSLVLGVAALFSGAALLAHILLGVSLRVSLGVTASAMALCLAVVWTRAPGEARRRSLHTAGVGLAGGLIALVAYDGSKMALSWLDPSPYNPFEAVHRFGILLAGPQASPAAIWSLGVLFHALNGACFGVAYAFLWGRRGVLAGVAWGLFLELFQLTLFPGWLDIRLYREFAQISALSHLIYGGTLGGWCRRLLPTSALLPSGSGGSPSSGSTGLAGPPPGGQPSRRRPG